MHQDPPTRFAKNAPGAFYTTGLCMQCGAPEDVAPDLLAPLTETNWDTYFVRQPNTAEEVERACRAIEVCCIGTLRYAGSDEAILRRLAARPECCDRLTTDRKLPMSDDPLV